MRITREILIRIAKETVQKRVLSEPGLVAGYLVGSLRSENPFLGNTTDVDIVLVHPSQPKVRREILPLTPEIHLDIIHNSRSEYDKPKELRIHPWLGPELYDPLPLYGTRHFFEFIQAGVRAEYEEPVNVLARARKVAEHARQIWSSVQLGGESSPALLLSYLKSINHAANAVALLTGFPLAERRFMLQFQERSEAVGLPDLSNQLLNLLGGSQIELAVLGDFLPEWEKAFIDAAGRKQVHKNISAPRLAYYKRSFEAMLAGKLSYSILWPLIHTWTLAAIVLPPTHRNDWQAACETLGLVGEAFDERLKELDHFLDIIEQMLEDIASRNGL